MIYFLNSFLKLNICQKFYYINLWPLIGGYLMMQNFGWIIGFFVVILILSALLDLPSLSSARVKKRDFMTKIELAFWRSLVPAAHPLHVAPQVSLGALMMVAGGANKSESTSLRNRFDRGRADFVLFDDDGKVQLIVELDDRTHVAKHDAARDKRTRSAGYCTLRLFRRDAPNQNVLSDLIRGAVAHQSPGVAVGPMPLTALDAQWLNKTR